MPEPDLSEFYKLSRPKKAPCQIGVAAAQLSDTDASALEAAFHAHLKGLISAGAIEAWLANRDHKVSLSAVTCHRKGTCSCVDA